LEEIMELKTEILIYESDEGEAAPPRMVILACGDLPFSPHARGEFVSAQGRFPELKL
jgi:hypothetical protein